MATRLEEQKALHAQVCRLWDRYRDLVKAQLVLKGDVSDLERQLDVAGRKLIALYRASDAGLDAEGPDTP